LETISVVEWIARDCGKPGIPHQAAVENIVQEHWRASLVARASPIWSYDIIVLDTDRD
jgi:hypothetical protein